jgi:phosphoserine aminotransferase
MAEAALFERELDQARTRSARTVNFSASGGHVPKEVLDRAARDLIDWRRTGQGVLGLPFTGAQFRDLLAEAIAALRGLLGLPGNYRVLFMQGGASAQFSLVPMNLLRGAQSACYADTGYWSKRAIAAGAPICTSRRTRPRKAGSTASFPGPARCRWLRT